LGVQANDVVFTSGGSESVQAALLGAWLAAGGRGHVITGQAEHHAVLHTCELLAELGARITYLPPQPDGSVTTAAVLAALQPDTRLISLMAVNNETGAVTPVAETAAAVKRVRPDVVVHSDMVQALGLAPLRLSDTLLDLASFSGHKIHGPKGVGVLYIRQGTPWRPVLRGGAQERGRRAGTEHVAGIVGLGAAAAWLQAQGEQRWHRLEQVRAAFVQGLHGLPGVWWNSPCRGGAASVLNVSFAGVRSDRLLMRLDLEGVAASAGAACSAGSLQPSHVLQACGWPPERVETAVRFSFSSLLDPAEVLAASRVVAHVVQDLRKARLTRG
ncbi:MAG: aminotransferase class V-fold PLP-dependent enzyme, partial [Alicyclobacillus sp.]|nr:aminotransferase class V-fold PLP-dependent enzyme [Alicyclobacillus sp.]